MNKNTPVIDWTDAERAAWAPKSESELAREMTLEKLFHIERSLEGLHLEIQLARALLLRHAFNPKGACDGSGKSNPEA